MEICREAEHHFLSLICLPEMISTLYRLVREGKLTGDQYQQIKDFILDDFEDVEVCDITTEVIKQTMECLERNPLRAMEALHIDCALAVNPDLLVSFDRRPGPFPDVLGHIGGKPDFDAYAPVANNPEGGAEEFLRIEVGRIVERSTHNSRLLDALHGKCSYFTVYGNICKHIKSAIVFREMKGLDLVLFNFIVLAGMIPDGAAIPLNDGVD
jgi:predicted nucleic acid-binding protein